MVEPDAVVAALGAGAVVLGVRDLWVPTSEVYLRRSAVEGGRRRSTLAGRLVERLGRPLAPVLARAVGEPSRRRLAARIDAAGRPDGLTVDRLLAKRAGVLTLGAVVLAAYAAQDRLVTGLVVAAVVAGSVDLTLHRQARRRQDEIEQSLPDLIDAITVSLGAGSAFRPTVARLCERWDGPASEELATTLRALDVGAGRRAAFTGLQNRNTSPALRQFAAAVVQAEELGTSIATTLRALADQMRRTAGQRARRRADSVEKRIIVINAVLFLPAMMVMLVTVSLLGFGVAGAFSG